MAYSVRTAHPRFFDKLYAGSDSIGQLGEFLTAVLNTNVHTYAVSPVFAVMETAVIKRVAGLLGFNPDTAEGTCAQKAQSNAEQGQPKRKIKSIIYYETRRSRLC